MTEQESKSAILVVSFGTSDKNACKLAIEATKKSLAVAFPKYLIASAITSHHLVKQSTVCGQERKLFVDEALEKLANEGVDKVLVQPLHIIPGYEYEKVIRAMNSFSTRFKRLVVAKPLLDSPEDYDQTALALLPLYESLKEGECLVLMGHGTQHEAYQCYLRLNETLSRHNMDKAFVATIEGLSGLEELIPQLKQRGFCKLVLRPLMLVAGNHAHNDMAGDEPDSWKSILTREGFAVQVDLRGLGELDAIRQIYIRHTQTGLEALEDD